MLKDALFLGARLRRLAAQLPYLPRTMGLVWTAARGWTAAWIAVLLVQGVLPVATVYLTRTVVNRLIPALLGPMVLMWSLMLVIFDGY